MSSYHAAWLTMSISVVTCLYTQAAINIMQLLTIEALDMMWCRPESTNIDWSGAQVNISILRSTSHHVQCLNSQQLFYYIISLNKKATTTKSWPCTMSWTVLNFFFLIWWLTDFIQLKEAWMHTLFVITVKPPYIATIGKREFWRYNEFGDRGMDFCQLHVDIMRYAWDIVSTLSLRVIP